MDNYSTPTISAPVQFTGTAHIIGGETVITLVVSTARPQGVGDVMVAGMAAEAVDPIYEGLIEAGFNATIDMIAEAWVIKARKPAELAG